MSKQVVDLKPVGLYTDPNQHSSAPSGAMLEASEVYIRREGLVEPRESRGDVAPTMPGAGSEIYAVIPFDGDLLVMSSPDGSTWHSLWQSDGTSVSNALNPYVGNSFRWDVVRDALYVLTQRGAFRINAALDTSAIQAGLPPPRLVDDTPTTTTLAYEKSIIATKFYAYRACFRREYGNPPKIQRGPVSGRYLVEGDPTNDQYIRLDMYLMDQEYVDPVVEGDYVEIYRTLQSDIDPPGAEMYLAAEHRITANDVTTGTINVRDKCTEENLGAALYTNPGQKGLSKSHYMPPRAADIATFQNTTFYADTESLGRVVLDFKDFSRETGFSNLTGATYSISGDFADGSNTILNASANAQDLGVGMSVGNVSGSASVATGTLITDITGTTITLSNNVSGTQATATFDAYPVIEVNGQKFYGRGENVDVTYPGFNASNPAGTVPGRDFITSLAYIINTHDDIIAIPTAVIAENLCVEEGDAVIALGKKGWIDSAESNFDVQAWPGGGVSPSLVAAYETPDDDFPNRLMWSEPGQPEAVPLVNFVHIGREDKAILRILATRDALWILKEDGVWRLTGTGGDSWRIDPISTDTYLLNRECACVLGEQVFAWTNKGLVIVGDGGVTHVSESYIGSDLSAISSSVLSSGTTGAWVTPYITNDEVWLAVPSAAANNYASTIYIWNAKTQTFVSQTEDTRFGIVNPADDEMYLAHREASPVYELLTKDEDPVEVFTCTLEWIARSKNPTIQKLWMDGVFSFETVNGIDTLTVSMFSDISTTPSTTAPSFTEVTTDRNEPIRWWVQRNHARAVSLYPKIVILNATNLHKWRLSGLSVSFNALTTHVRRDAP